MMAKHTKKHVRKLLSFFSSHRANGEFIQRTEGREGGGREQRAKDDDAYLDSLERRGGGGGWQRCQQAVF